MACSSQPRQSLTLRRAMGWTLRPQGTGTGASANAGLVGRTMQWFKLSKPGSRERVGDIQLMVEVGSATTSKHRDEELGDGLLCVTLPLLHRLYDANAVLLGVCSATLM